MPRSASVPATPSRASARSPASAPVGGERPASPFETDRARKSQLPEPEMSSAEALPVESRTQAATAVAVEDSEVMADPGKMLGCILTELEKGGHKMLASTLEEGTVELLDSELRITVSQSKGVIELL